MAGTAVAGPALGRFLFILLGIVTVAVGFARPALAQDVQPTLTGEALAGFSFVDTNAECRSDGSTITFNTAGPAGGQLGFDDIDVAAGPYPGTFDASGTVKSGPSTFTGDPFGNGVITVGVPVTFTESFRIFSGDTTITGTKNIEGIAAEGFVACGDFMQGDVHNQIREIQITNARYEATIAGPNGTFKDRGTTRLEVNNSFVDPVFPIPGVPVRSSASERFREFFTSDLLSAEPALPTTSDDCVPNQFEAFGVFKNRGDCVAFVETEGRNEPGRNIPNPKK